MRYTPSIAYLLTFQVIFAKTNSVKCPKNEFKCLCIHDVTDLEFHCPPNFDETGGFVMHYSESEKDLSFDCFEPYLETLNVAQLPNITLQEIERFTINDCPLPETSFGDILNHFGVIVNRVKYLQFANYAGKSVSLNKNYFKGLEMLETLNFEGNTHLIFDKDVFDNTQFLTRLELPENRLKLSHNFFSKLSHLKSLDISRNEVKNLPDKIFHSFPNLEELQLWRNNLTKINESSFDGLTNLKSLSLDVNNIDFISETAFKNLKNLTQIELSKNRLHTISSNLFKENTLLQSVFLNRNAELIVPDFVFSNLTVLTRVELAECGLDEIPKHIFENSINLQIIFLNGNSLKHIPLTLFKNLGKLKVIHLENNLLSSISKTFHSLTKLEELYLDNNSIEIIEQDAFRNLINLKVLTLHKNKIAQIDPHTFSNLENLKQIDLSHNIINGHKSNSLMVLFENNPSLQDVNLRHNRIINIMDVINIHNKINLRNLDLSHNFITNIPLPDLQAVTIGGKLVIRLDYNNITKIDFEDLEYEVAENPPVTVIYLNNNPIECDCRNYDLLKYFRNKVNPAIITLFEIKTENLTCASPPELEDLPVTTLSQSPKLMTCSLAKMKEDYLGCPEECSCEWRPFDASIILNCSNRNLQTYPYFVLPYDLPSFDQVEMHLQRSNLSMGPDGNLTCYNNVTKLFLSHNKINALKWVPPRLEVLRLDNNQIKHLDKQVLTRLNTSHLGNLTLDNNPWLCDCEAEDLKAFLRRHPRQVNASTIYCHNSNNILLIDQNLCQEWQVAILIVPILALLLLVAVAAALYYRYQQELKIWLFAKNLCLWWVTEEDVDKDKTYDAFISYSHKDEDFVTQNLVPRLENGPNRYKLCLHYRNFVPGEFIAKQVTSSVIESRRTLVVLSPNFLESVWGKLEFRTAHAQAMAEGRVRVIIVLYGDIDINSLDDELKAYLRTNTYIKWGDAHFWDRLIYALPHSKKSVSTYNWTYTNGVV